MKFLKTSAVFILLYCVLSACNDDNNPTPAGIELLSRLDFPETMTDVWGYVDPNTNKEYALIGFGLFNDPPNSGVYIVDVSDARNPLQVARVNDAPGFDMKVWRNFMYTVNGRGGTGGIVDISDPANPRLVGSFPSSHNIFISDDGFMFSECPGLIIYDLNPDPTNPTQVWSDNDDNGNCHDSAVIGDRLYDFHGSGGTNIYDVSNRAAPQLLGTINPPSIRFHHSGWPTEDGRYLFICDEGAAHPSADFTVWDIGDPANPQLVDSFADSAATIHNIYIVGDFAYAAYYNSGFRVFDVSNPRDIKVVDEFDTNSESGEGFLGAFGAYVFAPSGNIYVSDMQNGLHVFSFAAQTSNRGVMAP